MKVLILFSGLLLWLSSKVLLKMFRPAIVLLLTTGSCGVLKDEGRSVVPALLFPFSSPSARHQLIWGVGVPLEYQDESLSYGLALKIQYFLPLAPNQLKPGLNWATRSKRSTKKNETISRKREEKIFKSILDEQEHSRWDFYSGLEGIARQ